MVVMMAETMVEELELLKESVRVMTMASWRGLNKVQASDSLMVEMMGDLKAYSKG